MLSRDAIQSLFSDTHYINTDMQFNHYSQRQTLHKNGHYSQRQTLSLKEEKKNH